MIIVKQPRVWRHQRFMSDLNVTWFQATRVSFKNERSSVSISKLRIKKKEHTVKPPYTIVNVWEQKFFVNLQTPNVNYNRTAPLAFYIFIQQI